MTLPSFAETTTFRAVFIFFSSILLSWNQLGWVVYCSSSCFDAWGCGIELDFSILWLRRTLFSTRPHLCIFSSWQEIKKRLSLCFSRSCYGSNLVFLLFWSRFLVINLKSVHTWCSNCFGLLCWTHKYLRFWFCWHVFIYGQKLLVCLNFNVEVYLDSWNWFCLFIHIEYWLVASNINPSNLQFWPPVQVLLFNSISGCTEHGFPMKQSWKSRS